MTTRAVPERDDRTIGRVRWCSGCREWWPRDAEFWFLKPNGRPRSYCRACWSEGVPRRAA